MLLTDGCMKPLIIHLVWSVVRPVSTGLVKIQVPITQEVGETVVLPSTL